MALKFGSRARPLLVVAHPDDESIFFGGLVQRFRGLDATIVCVTDGNAEGRGAQRHEELLNATKQLGVKKVLHWDFADNYPGRLPTTELIERLEKLDKFSVVFTHGVTGEYGHPHHQDVSYAVHKVFGARKIPVWSAAYNTLGEEVLLLSEKEYRLKMKVIQQTYRLETQRFLNILQGTRAEYLHRVSPKLVEEIYAWITDETKDLPKRLGAYEVLRPFLADRTYLRSAKGFFNNYFAE